MSGNSSPTNSSSHLDHKASQKAMSVAGEPSTSPQPNSTGSESPHHNHHHNSPTTQPAYYNVPTHNPYAKSYYTHPYSDTHNGYYTTPHNPHRTYRQYYYPTSHHSSMESLTSQESMHQNMFPHLTHSYLLSQPYFYQNNPAMYTPTPHSYQTTGDYWLEQMPAYPMSADTPQMFTPQIIPTTPQVLIPDMSGVHEMPIFFPYHHAPEYADSHHHHHRYPTLMHSGYEQQLENSMSELSLRSNNYAQGGGYGYDYDDDYPEAYLANSTHNGYTSSPNQYSRGRSSISSGSSYTRKDKSRNSDFSDDNSYTSYNNNNNNNHSSNNNNNNNNNNKNNNSNNNYNNNNYNNYQSQSYNDNNYSHNYNDSNHNNGHNYTTNNNNNNSSNNNNNSNNNNDHSNNNSDNNTNDSSQYCSNRYMKKSRDSFSGNQTSDLLSKLRKHFDPRSIEKIPLKEARYYVIKSYSEQDIRQSIKHEIWTSTESGNKRLNSTYNEQKNKPIYLFFSVNASGHFCGVAEMTSEVDFHTHTGLFSQEKWRGKFKVKWIYIKDVPNQHLRRVRLNNNEGKPITNSRDCQEVFSEQGCETMKLIMEFNSMSSILDDMDSCEINEDLKKFLKKERHSGGAK